MRKLWSQIDFERSTSDWKDKRLHNNVELVKNHPEQYARHVIDYCIECGYVIWDWANPMFFNILILDENDTKVYICRWCYEQNGWEEWIKNDS